MSKIKITTIANVGDTKEMSSDYAMYGTAQVWVNFNAATASGTGTGSIRDSFNVASITDNGTGNMTINFEVDFPDTDYCWVGHAGDDYRTNYGTVGMGTYGIDAVGSVRVVQNRDDGGTYDPVYMHFIAYHARTLG